MRPKTCTTCSVLMEICIFDGELTFACNNPICYMPNFIRTKNQLNTGVSTKRGGKSKQHDTKRDSQTKQDEGGEE